MTGFFLGVYDALRRHSWLKIGLPVFLFAGMLFLGSRIVLEEDISGFLPDNRENERLNFVYKHLGIADKIFVRFSLSDTLAGKKERTERLIGAAEEFVSRLDSSGR